MNELVKINYIGGDHPTVSGRELHRALQIKTAYKDWFPRMCEYGFAEGVDFSAILSESTGGRPSTDHQLTINMAKELCMIQRSDIGKRVRQYFLQVEAAWNSPDTIMARALQFANEGKIPVALIHPASAGHGLNLQDGGSTIVWFGLTWSLELYQQLNARLWRQGQKHTVVIQHIVAAGTHDEDIMNALEKKDMSQTALIAAVKARIGGVT